MRKFFITEIWAHCSPDLQIGTNSVIFKLSRSNSKENASLTKIDNGSAVKEAENFTNFDAKLSTP